MNMPLYRGFSHPGKYLSGGHAGLWYDRFFNKYDDYWSVPDGGKIEWIETVTLSLLGGEKVSQFCGRQTILVDSLGGKSIIAKTSWHFVTGLGNNHPVENGFAWHPTLGVPYLTGAAVKGLLRAWCEVWSDTFLKNGEDKADTLRRWFGPSLDELKPKKGSSIKKQNPAVGELIFFDALPTGPVVLKADVMTPHMGKWYEKGGEKPKPDGSNGGENPEPDGSNVPADWHSPKPVPFLVVAPGQAFQFSVAARPGSAIIVDDVVKELESALAFLGAGAKTAVGYGSMRRDPEAEAHALKEREEREAQARAAEEARRREDERQAELAKLDPVERSVREFLDTRADKNQPVISAVIGAVKQRRWQGEEKVAVARWLKTAMQNARQWKETSQAKKPEKDREYQNTLQVKAWLEEK
jgi:CRISPR-associated protein Cmr6